MDSAQGLRQYGIKNLLAVKQYFLRITSDGRPVCFVKTYWAFLRPVAKFPGPHDIDHLKGAHPLDCKTPYRLEDQIGFKLRLANQKHLEIFNRMMPDITPTQFAVMAKLHDLGTLSQNHLGRLVGMDAATTKGVVDRLRKKGLAESTPSTSDMRRLEISLTDAGRACATRAVQTARDISAATAQNLTARELERLLTLLDKL
jgi:DNA-binding MarR family transcriptional regulator